MSTNPKTPEELRELFLQHIRVAVREWDRYEKDTCREKLSGLAFTILALLDGCDGDFPAVDLVLRPAEDHKEYHIARGERWIEDGTVINADCHLHELWYRKPVSH